MAWERRIVGGRRSPILVGLLAAVAAASAQPAAAAPCLAVEVTARPQQRAALAQVMAGAQARLVAGWRADGDVIRGETLFTRDADQGVWDAMVMLTFRDDAAMARWRAHAGRDGAIAPEALSLARTVATSPCDSVRGGGPATATRPSILVIPYVALVPPGEYLAYLDCYTVPQLRGWIAEGVLDSYEIVTSRFPAGRPWNATIMLRYRDDASLARRDEIVAKVRARLAADPAWKAYSDSKKAVRSEGRLAVADDIAPAR